MAQFEIAYKKTSIAEGGYSNHPDDTGGETWKGIARKKNPDWSGWKIVDAYRPHAKFPAILNTLPALEQEVKSFYQKNYWDKVRGTELNDQTIANSIYDSAVNMGPVAAIKLAQKALNIYASGSMDDLTIKTMNA